MDRALAAKKLKPMIYLIAAALIFVLTLTYCAGTFLANIVSDYRERRAEKLKAEILNSIL